MDCSLRYLCIYSLKYNLIAFFNVEISNSLFKKAANDRSLVCFYLQIAPHPKCFMILVTVLIGLKLTRLLV